MRIDDACDSVGGMSSPFAALVPLIDRQFARFGREAPLPGVRLSRAEAPGGPIHSVYGPSLGVVVQGAKISVLGDRSFRYGAGQGLVAGIDVPVTAYLVEASPDRPYLAVRVSIDPPMRVGLRRGASAAGGAGRRRRSLRSSDSPRGQAIASVPSRRACSSASASPSRWSPVPTW